MERKYKVCAAGLVLFAAVLTAAPGARGGDGVTVAGFAFVDTSVTSEGSRAALPAGVRIFPSGSTITGTEGCPTTPYRTDGLPVVVMDYAGRPSAGSVAIVQHLADGRVIERAPYQLNFDPGRVLQYLGPVFDNGTYELTIEYFFGQGVPHRVSATLVLDRHC